MLDNDFKDDPSPLPLVISSFKMKTKSDVYTSGIKYKNIFQNNEFTTGLTYRIKNYTYPLFIRQNSTSLEQGKEFSQKLTTIFVENKYLINQN